jgi:hypothetical protein
MTTVPQGYFISTPVNKAVASAPAVGFGTGYGGAVTQGTSKTTGVTLNTKTGVITMHNAALADAASVKFTLTNSSIGGTDVVICNQGTGGTAGSYVVECVSAGAGSAVLRVTNISGGSLSEALTINFAVIDCVNA